MASIFDISLEKPEQGTNSIFNILRRPKIQTQEQAGEIITSESTAGQSQEEKDLLGYQARQALFESGFLKESGLEATKPRKYGGFFNELGRSIKRSSYGIGAAGLDTLENIAQESVFEPGAFSDKAESLKKKAAQIEQSEGGGVRGFIANSVGEALPFTLAAVGSTIATGSPYAAFATAFMIEGQQARDNALQQGASDEEADMEAFVVGVINGALEQLQVDEILKFSRSGKGSIQAIVAAARERSMKKILKEGGKLTFDAAKTSLKEGIQEALQESTTQLAPGLNGRDLPDIGEFASAVGQSFLGGAVVGPILGAGGAIISAEGKAKSETKLNITDQAKFKEAALTPDGADQIAAMSPEAAAQIAEKDQPSRKDLKALGISGKWSADERKQFGGLLGEALGRQTQAAVQPLQDEVPAEDTTVPPKPTGVDVKEKLSPELQTQTDEALQIARKNAREHLAPTELKEEITEPNENIQEIIQKPIAKPKSKGKKRKVKVDVVPAKPKSKGKIAPIAEAKQVEKPVQTLEEIEGTGEAKPRGLSKSVEAVAVEKELTEFFEDVPEYKEAKMKDQAKLATDLINSDYEKAKLIAMGLEDAPQGVIPEMVLVAVSNKAIRDGDVNTLRDISVQSRLTKAATTMGQRIRALGELGDHSPIKAIHGVVAAKEKAYNKRNKEGVESAKKSDVSQVKESVRKARPDNGAKALNKFILSLQC